MGWRGKRVVLWNIPILLQYTVHPVVTLALSPTIILSLTDSRPDFFFLGHFVFFSPGDYRFPASDFFLHLSLSFLPPGGERGGREAATGRIWVSAASRHPRKLSPLNGPPHSLSHSSIFPSFFALGLPHKSYRLCEGITNAKTKLVKKSITNQTATVPRVQLAITHINALDLTSRFEFGSGYLPDYTYIDAYRTTCSEILKRCPLSLPIVFALASSSYCTTHAAYSSGLSVFPTPSPLFPPFPSLGRHDFSLLPSLLPTRFSPADFQTIQDFPVPHGGGGGLDFVVAGRYRRRHMSVSPVTTTK